MTNSPKSLLLRGLRDRDNHYFNAIRYYRQRQQKKQKDSYSWAAQKYKIYPSALSSVNMCPHTYIREDVHKPPDFPIDVVYKMEAGKAYHTMFQDASLNIEGLLYDKPTVPEWAQEKLDANWPEIPIYFFDPYYSDLPEELQEEVNPHLISGRLDHVLNIDEEPVVFDIKSTAIDKARWLGGYTDNLPPAKYALQVKLYANMVNRENFYDKKVTRVALGYVNILMESGSEGSEKEIYLDYTGEDEKKIDNLLNELAKERFNFLMEIDEPCSYTYCSKHKSGI